MDESLTQNFEKGVVDANEGGSIKIKSTTFHIPPKAFVNRAGNLVAGDVEIKLKEYHDYVDFFMSGIPMEYDSLGTKYQLESAGMIEVYAEQDGQRVKLALGKTIDIELESEISVPANSTKAPQFNIYKLDTENRNWVYEAADNISFAEKVSFDAPKNDGPEEQYTREKEKIETEFNSALKKIETQYPIPAKPISPQKANSDAYTFELDIEGLVNTAAISSPSGAISKEHDAIKSSEKELRDLKKKYAKAVWEVLPGQANWSPAIAQTEWEDFDLQKSGKFDFVVTFIKGEQSVDIKVKPVLVGANYEEAVNAFAAEFSAYQKELDTRNEILAKNKAELEEVRRIKQKAADLKFEEKIQAYKAAGRDHLATEETIKRKVLNNFSISSFGTWNCDRPLPPFVYEVVGDFKDKSAAQISGVMAYLVDKNRNTVYRFVTTDASRIRFDKNSDNIMWIVTKDNKLATYRPEKFKQVTDKTKNHTFVMDLENGTIDNEDDIRRILKF